MMKFDQLTVPAINWLIDRGYVKRIIEDDIPVLTLTQAGQAWLINIEANNAHRPGRLLLRS